MRVKLLLCCLLCTLFVNVGVAKTKAPVNTAVLDKDVMTAAIDNPFGNYLNYRIIGMCFWLHWTPIGPYTTTTYKVNQFLPDAVVSVYNGYKQNPWLFAKTFVDPVMHALGNAEEKSFNGNKLGHGTSSSGDDNDMMSKFKEVSIVGDPALSVLFSEMSFAFIRSEASPYKPYYSSLADAYLWRNPILDDVLHPEYLIPGIRTEGSLIDQWGPIFPRIGYVTQLGDYKAAGVLALRAADIATHHVATHVYTPLRSGSCGYDCHVWPSHENDFANVKYQEIYPTLQTHAKRSFGIDDIPLLHSYDQSQYLKSHGNYVWVMWRHYKGCIQGTGQFIGSV
tara:strand:- start:52589 stop:53599 length:1011 start_codon:yes stop_codon:yes gene_type:complete